MTTGRYLVIPEPDDPERAFLLEALRRLGGEVTEAASPACALRALASGVLIDGVIVSCAAELAPGVPALPAIRAARPEVPTIAMADGSGEPGAVEALRAGAADFLTRPLAAEEIRRSVERARGRAPRWAPAAPAAAPAPPRPRPTTLADAERELILRALRETNGNRTESARRLGISVRTLWNRLKRYEEEGHLAPRRGRPSPRRSPCTKA